MSEPDKLYVLNAEAAYSGIYVPLNTYISFLSEGSYWNSWSTRIVWHGYQIAELRINQPVRERMMC